MVEDRKPTGSIRLVIESRLEDIPMVGVSVSRLCALIPLDEIEADKVKLCVVEALNNSIIHAYGNIGGHEVATVFSWYSDQLVVQVCDAGRSMDERILRESSLFPTPPDRLDIEDIPECGRGLGIIKSIMDSVEYRTEPGKNCLVMIKRIHTSDEESE